MAKNSQNPVSESDTNNAAKTENPVANAETEAASVPTGAMPPTEKARYAGVKTFAYVGPSLPGGRLKSNTVLSGTYAEITEYYKDAITEYPNVARLIVPVARLAEFREKTLNSGNVMHKYYAEIVATIRAKGEEQ